MNKDYLDKVDLAKLKSGDEDAFQSLFQSYYVPLCLYSVQITESIEDSEDLVQDFFLRFWEKGFYREVDSNLKSYLFNAVRNLSLNYLKKHRTYVFEELEERVYLQEEDCTEEDVKESYHHLHAAFQRLSPQEAKVLRCIVLQGKTYKEVAQEMSVSVNTVKTYLARGIRFLRIQLLILSFFIYFLKYFLF